MDLNHEALDLEGETLRARAAANYPDDPQLQRAWLHAVEVVRTTRRGWLLDRHVQPVNSERFHYEKASV